MTTTAAEKQTATPVDFGKGFRDYQKQMLEFQKNAFDTSFESFVTFQEQQGRFISDLVERTTGIPEEGKEFVQQWVETFRRGREDYKATVDKSYDLMIRYFERDVDEDANQSAA